MKTTTSDIAHLSGTAAHKGRTDTHTHNNAIRAAPDSSIAERKCLTHTPTDCDQSTPWTIYRCGASNDCGQSARGAYEQDDRVHHGGDIR